MTRQQKRSLSKDHVMEREGAGHCDFRYTLEED
jgi:hypothetical protein